VTKGKSDIDVNMEEIDRKIDEMAVLDLRDPKGRKKTSVNIDDIVGSFDLEATMRNAGHTYPRNDSSENDSPENSKTGNSDPDAENN
jgi:hypothetical protein